jgi:UDP-3-O-[3-hydroxymyristoyl] N-acetylglucosamine deacetylase
VFQATLAGSIALKGIGVHSGSLCQVSVLPAEKDSGIIFRRANMPKTSIVEADYKNVSEAIMCTKISGPSGKITFATVEHLMSALYGLGISNAIVETSGEEIPILDGSAEQFVEKIISAKINAQSKKRKALKIQKTIKVEDGKRWSSLSPHNAFIIDIECDYGKNKLKTDPFSFVFSKDEFIKEIAPARTFGFFSDIEFLRKNNLAKGASLENAVVFDENGAPMNENGLRFENEPVRHKVLDIIGDLSLSRHMIIGKFEGFCPSHKMNTQLLKLLFEDAGNFEIAD